MSFLKIMKEWGGGGGGGKGKEKLNWWYYDFY